MPMTFSKRSGYKKSQPFQVDGIDTPLRNALWNAYIEGFCAEIKEYHEHDLLREIFLDFFEKSIEELRDYHTKIGLEAGLRWFISNWFFKTAQWYEIFDFIEYLPSLSHSLKNPDAFRNKSNAALEKKNSAYRLINDQIVPITLDTEIKSIDQAIQVSASFPSVNEHLHQALAMLSDRNRPDYRNSIKESISAIESYCGSVLGEQKSTLGKLLAGLERNHGLHPSLKESISKLYGFASDAGGIRHALQGDSETFELSDAKFILVFTTAFINYLDKKHPEINSQTL